MNNNSTTSYSYQAALAIGLCAGTIGGVGRYWSNKSRYAGLADALAPDQFSLFTGANPQSPWGYLTAKHPDQAIGYAGLAYAASPLVSLDSSAAIPNYSFEVAGVGMTLNLVTSGSTSTVSIMGPDWLTSEGWDGAAYNGLLSDYSHIVHFGTTWKTSQYVGKPVQITFTGGASEVSILDNVSGDQINGVASGSTFTLSSAFTISSGPDFAVTALSVEVSTAATYNFTSSVGVSDENPKVVIVDLLSRAQFPSAKLGDLTNYSNYVLAANLLVSPAYTEQRAAKDMLLELSSATNSEFVWSQGLLTLVPYADATYTGNGVTFTPNLTPWYDLNDDDYIVSSSGTPGQQVSDITGQSSGMPGLSAVIDDPVQCTRTTSADAFNHIQIEYLDRSQDYNIAIAEAKDQSDIEAKGLRTKDPIKMHFICERSIAESVARSKSVV